MVLFQKLEEGKYHNDFSNQQHSNKQIIILTQSLVETSQKHPQVLHS